MPANKKYKDSVFSKFLSDPKRLVDVYNAIEGTNYPPDTPVEINTLDDVLYKERINDLSFTLDNQVLVLIEHQSTINYNMAIRLLMYVGRLYEKLVKNDVIYREKPVEIPMPKFVVLYNGKEDLPEYSVQKLSDSYKIKQEKVSLELKVDVYNINYEKSPELLQHCKSLNEYSTFIHQVKENQKCCETLDEAIEKAIQYCVSKDIMKEFLEANGSEVENMLYTEWDWDKALAIHAEEAYEDGVAYGEKRGLAKGIEQGEKRGIELGEKRGIEKGLSRGAAQKQNELIRKFSKRLSPEDIAETLQLSKEYVLSVLQEPDACT